MRRCIEHFCGILGVYFATFQTASKCRTVLWIEGAAALVVWPVLPIYMKGGGKPVRKTLVIIQCLALVLTMSVAASASCVFADVPSDSPYCESVEYLYYHGITSGTGGYHFAPNDTITVRQWSAMLCRAYGTDASDWKGCVYSAYTHGWINEAAVTCPDMEVSFGYLLESGFAASGVHVYRSDLYDIQMNRSNNLMRIGRELGLCGTDVSFTDIVTRATAATVLHKLLTRDLNVVSPASPVKIENRIGANLNGFLIELRRVPPGILDLFNRSGWKIVVDKERTSMITMTTGRNCAGVTYYDERTIYTPDAYSIVHELGHFLDCMLGFPNNVGALFNEEAQFAPVTQYGKTNRSEYFAECFVYWVAYWNNADRMEMFRLRAPKTYEYMNSVIENLKG